MGRPKFIADEDLDGRIVAAIHRREPTIDLLGASEAEIRGLRDPDVLSLAAASGRILISHDRNTMLAHFADFCQQRESPGLITLKQKAPIGDVVDSIILIWAASDAHEWVNASSYIPL